MAEKICSLKKSGSSGGTIAVANPSFESRYSGASSYTIDLSAYHIAFIASAYSNTLTNGVVINCDTGEVSNTTLSVSYNKSTKKATVNLASTHPCYCVAY